MHRVAALILAGGRASEFGVLAEHRTKAAFPICGYYRIIDFALSNLSHSDVSHVGIIIQYLPASLVEHIGSGRPWDYDMAGRRLQFMTPFIGVRETRWFNGTGDAVAKNLNLVTNQYTKEILILSGEHVYRMDYRMMVMSHRMSDADLTLAYVKIPKEKQHPRFGSMLIDDRNRVLRFEEKPRDPISENVFIGVYCFKYDVLSALLEEAREQFGESHISLPGDILARNINRMRVYAYEFDQPWYYLGGLESYYQFHMDFARGEAAICEPWDIMTNFSDRTLGSRPPAFHAPKSEVLSSVISADCRIEGDVRGSVLSPGVQVLPGAVVENSIIFHDCVIEAGARVSRAILDKDTIIDENAVIGSEDGPITVAPKGYHVPPQSVIGPGSVLESKPYGTVNQQL